MAKATRFLFDSDLPELIGSESDFSLVRTDPPIASTIPLPDRNLFAFRLTFQTQTEDPPVGNRWGTTVVFLP